MLIPHKGHTDTIQVYSVTVMTHVKALQAGHSSQGTSEPITPALVGDPPPICVSCQERLFVEHILIYCAEYIDIRDSCFNVNTVRELFDTVPPVLIISLRRAGLLYLI